MLGGLRGQVKRAAEIRVVAAEVAVEAEPSAVFVAAVFPASAAPVAVSVAAVFVVAPVFARVAGSAAGVAAPFAAAWPDLPVAEPLSRVVAPAVAEAFGAAVPAWRAADPAVVGASGLRLDFATVGLSREEQGVLPLGGPEE